MIRRLRGRFLLRDLRRRPAATVALAVLLSLSALLMATGGIVVERLLGSVDGLFEQAQPPHFLQMHRGALDRDALATFAAQHPEIDAWLVEEMLGFDGSAIGWSRGAAAGTNADSGDLSDSLVDHLFVTQNEDFDFLIDETGTIPHPSAGEVYVPVSEQQRYDLRRGDELRVGTGDDPLPLRIAGFVRDAQMASSFASSSRFVVSDADFGRLAALGGDPEVIVEYRLDDPDGAATFQRAYEADADLPREGQAVTFQMIRLLNAISDGLVAVAVVFAGLVIIAIAFVNLRFVIRGSIEEDVREIGTLKAIGLSRRSISGLYFAKYRVITLAACAIGGSLSPLAAELLLSGIRTNYGTAPVGVGALIVPVLALALVYLLVSAICHGVLRAIGRIETVRALVHGSTLTERAAARRARRAQRRSRRSRLVTSRRLPLATRLSLIELRADWRRWALVPIVFALATVLITLPANLLSTLESPRFVTYLGAPDSDIRSDLQFGEDLDEAHRQLIADMDDDPRLTDVQSFARVSFEARASAAGDGDEDWQTLPVEAGDYAATSLEFLSGARPQEGQIALSALAAAQYGARPGDRLLLRGPVPTAAEPVEVVVSGIYQDVTSGGRTAKLQDPGRPLADAPGTAGFIVYANTGPDADPVAVAADYGERHPAASTVPMREYVQQTLSFATGSLRGASTIAFGFGIAVAALITALFLTLFLAREQSRLGLLHTLGFRTAELRRGVRSQALIAIACGVAAGAVVTAALDDGAITAVFSALGLGISRLTLTPDPWLAWVLYPLALFTAGALTAIAATRRPLAVDETSWLR